MFLRLFLGITILFCIILFGIYWYIGYQPLIGSIKEDQVCCKGQCFKVEVVQKQEDIERGLMDRSYLSADRGMLFVFSKMGRHAFWMKNTLIPLDIIWLDEEGRIADIAAQVPPCQQDPCPSYVPAREALYVLEINAHRSKALGLRKQDAVEFKISSSHGLNL